MGQAKSKDGRDGQDGQDGATGVPGVTGAPGVTGVPGTNGTNGTTIMGMDIDETGIVVRTNNAAAPTYTAKVDMGTGLKGKTLWCGADGKICRFPVGAPGINFTQEWQDTTKTLGVSEISNDTTNFKSLMIVGNNSTGKRVVSLWDDVNVNNNLSAGGAITTNGKLTAGSVSAGTVSATGMINSDGQIRADNIVTNKICSPGGQTCIELWDNNYGVAVKIKSAASNGTTAIQQDGNIVGYNAAGKYAWALNKNYNNLSYNFSA